MRPGSRVVRWLGDDAAVVRADGVAVVSTDVMVDGTHFRLGQATPEDAGWRALAGALSDVAAMGAEAGEAYLSVVLPASLSDAPWSRPAISSSSPMRPARDQSVSPAGSRASFSKG